MDRYRYLRASIICFAFSALMLWLLIMQGCAGEKFYRVTRLPGITVVVIGGTDRPDGMVFKGDTLIVTGRISQGKIYPDRDVLAHEIMHLLNWQDDAFANPDN